jgi:hypothetical protein
MNGFLHNFNIFHVEFIVVVVAVVHVSFSLMTFETKEKSLFYLFFCSLMERAKPINMAENYLNLF